MTLSLRVEHVDPMPFPFAASNLSASLFSLLHDHISTSASAAAFSAVLFIYFAW